MLVSSFDAITRFLVKQIIEQQKQPLNANKVYQSNKNRDLREALENIDLLLPDGMSVVWATKLLTAKKGVERISGIDLFKRLLSEGNKNSFSVFFFGATDEVLTEISNICRKNILI